MNKVYTSPANLTSFLSNDQITEKIEVDYYGFEDRIKDFAAPKTINVQTQEGSVRVVESDPIFSASVSSEVSLEDYFWKTRPVLSHIQTFARARLSSPWAVLGSVLVRTIAATPPNVVLPNIIGSVGSLNLFLANIAPSGGGKDAAKDVANECIDFGLIEDQVVRELGSGQGITAQYMNQQKVDGSQEKELRQFNDSVIFTISEIDALSGHNKQQGAIVIPTLTAAWMSQELGGAYKDQTKDQPMKPHTYRLCLIANVQPERSFIIFEHKHLGLPQRFLWLPATDPDMPDVEPECPSPLKIELPFGPRYQFDSSYKAEREVLGICDSAAQQIKDDRRRAQRGEKENDNPLDSHTLFTREKVAAALALLDSRMDINEEDWEIAGLIISKSLWTRKQAENTLTKLKAEQREAKKEEAVDIAQATEKGLQDQKRNRIAGNVLKRLKQLTEEEGKATKSRINQSISAKDRQSLPDVISYLEEIDAIKIEITTNDKGQPTEIYVAK